MNNIEEANALIRYAELQLKILESKEFAVNSKDEYRDTLLTCMVRIDKLLNID